MDSGLTKIESRAIEYGQWINRNQARSHRVWTVDYPKLSQEP